jgi:hypothetical protein
VEFASGHPDLGETGSVKKIPTDSSTYHLCLNQMVPSPGTHQNFSVVGIIIVLVLGGILIVLGVVIDPLVGWIQQRLRKGEYKRLSWIDNGFLELQKQAHSINGGFNPPILPHAFNGVVEENSRWQKAEKHTQMTMTDVEMTDMDPFMMGYASRKEN